MGLWGLVSSHVSCDNAVSKAVLYTYMCSYNHMGEISKIIKILNFKNSNKKLAVCLHQLKNNVNELYSLFLKFEKE